jgi:PhnB protein
MSSISVIPYIAVSNAEEALEFYQKAFGAKLQGKYPMADGRIIHSCLDFDGAMVFVNDEFPEHGGKSPLSLGGTPVTIHLQVPDADAIYKSAVEAGCTVKMPISDMFWGDRYACVVDPYGHNWSFGTTVKQVTPEELTEIVKNMDMGGGDCGEN